MKEKFLNTSLSPEERAIDLLGKMTIKEKVGQLNQKLFGFSIYTKNGDTVEFNDDFKNEVEKWGGIGVLYGLYRADPWSGKDFSDGLYGASAIEAYNAAQKYVMEHSRLGIPMLMSSECPHGHQALDGYLLPVNLAMGAAWNPDLVESAFKVVGKQMKEMGVDLALISMLDVLRDPRWGRSEECYSEDPYLCAQNAAAAVRGCTSQGVEALAKHFCAQGETTGGVNTSAASIGQRELREIHLPPMAAAAAAGAHGVMAAYNEIDGIPCHSNAWLLQDVLRDEMGFEGIVMADGCAVDRLGVLTNNDPAASAAYALSAGVDVSLWDEGFTHLEEAVERGLISEELLDRSVLRVLEMKFRRGLFEHPYLEKDQLHTFTYEDHTESLEIARQSAVLLKNDGILPIDGKKHLRIAVIGPNADAVYNQLGDYTPAQRENSCITPLAGIRDIMENAEVNFALGCSICGNETDLIADAAKLAAESDLVILALGGSSSRFAFTNFDVNGAAVVDGDIQMDCGEGVDSSSLELPGAQNKLAEAVFAAGTPVVSVIISGRPYAVPNIDKHSNAVLWSFYPGPQGGKAIAEILTGKTEPSGCMPVSVPRSTGQIPAYYNARSSYDKMTYRDIEKTPLYDFGYGLHYTDFSVDSLDISKEISCESLTKGESLPVACKVKNTGSRPGYAVVQLYIQALSGSIVRRCLELKNFSKIWLEPGEEKTVSLDLDINALGVWNRSMKFDAEPGTLNIIIKESGKTCCTDKIRII